MQPVHIRRALLFMPGDDRHKIEKGAALDADAVIMDLEDGVAATHKAAARDVTAQALQEVDFGRTERLVRLNAMDTGLTHEDLQAVVAARPDGIVLPKVEFPGQLQDVASWLTRAESRHGFTDREIILIAIIETALGVVNLADIVGATPRLQALAFGAEDLAGSMGAVRTPDGWEGFYARSAVVLHAKAFGLQAIDTPFVNLQADASLLASETEQALYMGYTGKFAIHPKQVDVIQGVFTPTPEQIDRARRLIDAHEGHQQAGEGVFVFEGKMVDLPMIRTASVVLARARAAGIEV